MDGSRLPITQALSAKQNVTYNILHEKPKEWPPCVPHRPQHSNRAKCWLILNGTSKIDLDVS